MYQFLKIGLKRSLEVSLDPLRWLLSRIQENFFSASKKVDCAFKTVHASKSCTVNHAIDSEKYILDLPVNSTVDRFDVSDNKEVKYLPRHIGRTFMQLKTFRAVNCGLTIVRNFYFENMSKVQTLLLNDNQIKIIEANAFKNLVAVVEMWLQRNMIETLDSKLFVSLVNLRRIDLQSNKIKFLKPTTFEISGGKLGMVSLWSNVCIDGWYDSINLDRLEPDLKANCTL